MIAVCFFLLTSRFDLFYLQQTFTIFSQEHECKLTLELIELIDREADLLTRGIKVANLEGEL